MRFSGPSRKRLSSRYLILFLMLLIFIIWGIRLVNVAEIYRPESPKPSIKPGNSMRATLNLCSPLYLFLKREGFLVVNISPVQLTIGNDIVLILEISNTTVKEHYHGDILGWVAGGGRLILFETGTSRLLERLGLEVAGDINRNGYHVMCQPHKALAEVKELEAIGGLYLKGELKNFVSVICHVVNENGEIIEKIPEDEEACLATGIDTREISLSKKNVPVENAYTGSPWYVMRRYGVGEIHVLATDAFHRKCSMVLADNPVFIYNLVREISRGRPIGFINENTQECSFDMALSMQEGDGKKKRRRELSLLSLILANPISAALVQLALAFSVSAYSMGKRRVPAVSGQERFYAGATYLASMCNLFIKKEAYSAAFGLILDEFRAFVRQKKGISGELEPATLARELSRDKKQMAELERFFRKCEVASNTKKSSAEIVALARRLDAIRKELEKQ